MNQGLIAELKMEAANTRKMLERTPLEDNNWKPHEHSMGIGRLAHHVAELPGWITMTMNTSELDFAKYEYAPNIPTNHDELLATHDKNVAEAIACLENCTDDKFMEMWTMRNGDNIFFTLPKMVVLRNWAYSHLYHHRGQLSVYLRLLDVAVPGMYGPSYDDSHPKVAAEEMASAN
jgi:uncharacterized damage-inducible protein DinB